MHYIQQLVFIIVSILAIGFFVKNINRISRNILQGKKIGSLENKKERWRLVVLNALGQKKMFKKPLPAFLHFFVYAGFIIINLEILEIMMDGVLGTHRLFAPVLGGLYPVLINCFEFLGVMVIVSCIIFLVRRNLLKLKRFHKPEMTRWPRMDANIILFIEIGLMLAFLTLDAADQQLQKGASEHYVQTGSFFFSSFLMPLFNGFGESTLIILERIGWWGHIIGVFIFMNYVPYSKHLHIFLSFPNTYYTKLESSGKISNMPEIQKEVQLMLDPSLATDAAASEPGRFGAKDVGDLTWKDLMGAYSCTECGRCTDVCPANITGKKLSPRKIMMDTRDRAEEIGNLKHKNGKDYEDGKALLGHYITHEEIFACTTCQACVEACPVNIDPLNIIQQLRRYSIMEEANSPGSWNNMFSNTENNQAPWQFSPSDRFNWSKEDS